MENQKTLRSLIKPQRIDQHELNTNANNSLVVPYCSSGYSTGTSGTSCSSGYSSNAWCVSSPAPDDDVLF